MIGHSGKLLLAGAVALATTMVWTPPANAESNWFRDFLRSDLERNRVARNAQDRNRVKRVPQRRAARIKAPSYYTYRTEALAQVDFSKLVAAEPELEQGDGEGTIALAPALTAFDAAVALLLDYELRAKKDIVRAIEAHYAEHRDFIWADGLWPNVRARAAVAFLEGVGAEGLNPEDYAVTLPALTFASADEAARAVEIARFEMTLSARVLRYVRDVTAGRVDANRLSGYHDLPVAALEGEALLAALAETDDATAWLDAKGPKGPHYEQLKRELAATRASAEADIIVDSKLFMRPGASDPDFAKLLQIVERDATPEFLAEHGALLETAMGSETYDKELVPLIKAVQKSRGLNPDGIIGPRTVGALSPISKAERIEKVLMALERLRWLPDELGQRRVFINQPEFVARYYEKGSEKLSTRVVVGKRANQTSFFYDVIEHVDFNPYWGVPQSIIVNEMMPKLLRDPGYLDRNNYEVTDARGRKLSPYAVNWGAYGAKVPYNVRQRPGRGNALGELKIMFPNKHHIYMHDTPHKSLFKRDTRAFSHGCVRLQKPREMAAAVLGTNVATIESHLAKGHWTKKLPVKIPVYIAYFTAWPGADGTVGYFPDIYGRDAHLAKALKAVASQRAPTG